MITNVDAVTVFNARTDGMTRRKVYIPTVIRGVSCMKAKGSTVTNNGVWSSDVWCKIRVPVDADIQDGRTYMQEAGYAKLDDQEAGNHWTITRGDMVAMGEYSGGSPLYEDRLQAFARETGMELVRITEYADNTSGGHPCTRHWRIGGK